MQRLLVLYDAECALCRRARQWLARQPAYVPLEFVPAGSARARTMFPDLDHAATAQTLTVIADDGSVWRGGKAWVMCLWALRNHRAVALTLGSRAVLPAARWFFDQLSRHRHRLGRIPWAPPEPAGCTESSTACEPPAPR